ncbi:hypothetical protein EGR_11279 [Echinococcus granulosus]|uniref:Uncharacterized protein n=1 Tax=Echinococcus granulosus TaxID=6210 RepID=W6TYK6_ECHGR|nr:hypothetical protein EGR_11279 [Echinococcus granulosus]EUB53870.1 hypothetical protein EGR_11279 [Echinococcus granulosus]
MRKALQYQKITVKVYLHVFHNKKSAFKKNAFTCRYTNEYSVKQITSLWWLGCWTIFLPLGILESNLSQNKTLSSKNTSGVPFKAALWRFKQALAKHGVVRFEQSRLGKNIAFCLLESSKNYFQLIVFLAKTKWFEKITNAIPHTFYLKILFSV